MLQQLTHLVLVALQLTMVDTLRSGVFLQGANEREARHATEAYLRKTVMVRHRQADGTPAGTVRPCARQRA